MTILYAIARYLGFGGCIALGLLGYYEGIPGAWRIPYLSNVPVLGDLSTGKVHSYAAEQVRIATATQKQVCDGRLEKMVSNTQFETVNAQLAEERRQLSEATRLSEKYRKQADDALRGEAEANKRLENAIAEDNANSDDDGAPRWTDADLEWLRLHREGAGTAGGTGKK